MMSCTETFTTGLFILSITLLPAIAGSEQPAADKVAIFLPVKSGINWIWSPKCQKTLLLKKEFQYLRSHKCISHYYSYHHAVWHLIARMKNQGKIDRENGTDARRYNLDALGFLEITNESVDDNGTEYKREVRTWDVDNGAQEAVKTIWISNNEPGQKSDFHDAGEGTGWKIGCVVAIVLFGLLGLALAVWKFRSYCTSQPTGVDGGPEVTYAGNESRCYVVNAREGTENGNLNPGKNCDSKTTLDKDDDVPMLKF